VVVHSLAVVVHSWSVAARRKLAVVNSCPRVGPPRLRAADRETGAAHIEQALVDVRKDKEEGEKENARARKAHKSEKWAAVAAVPAASSGAAKGHFCKSGALAAPLLAAKPRRLAVMLSVALPLLELMGAEDGREVMSVAEDLSPEAGRQREAAVAEDRIPGDLDSGEALGGDPEVAGSSVMAVLAYCCCSRGRDRLVVLCRSKPSSLQAVAHGDGRGAVAAADCAIVAGRGSAGDGRGFAGHGHAFASAVVDAAVADAAGHGGLGCDHDRPESPRAVASAMDDCQAEYAVASDWRAKRCHSGQKDSQAARHSDSFAILRTISCLSWPFLGVLEVVLEARFFSRSALLEADSWCD
jgi:hypothetical protein